MPMPATCAGLILLAESLSNDNHVCSGTLPVTKGQLIEFMGNRNHVNSGTLPMTVKRNA